ncbi:unnamed protein product [Effrenium voratum]|nr:unnamed protein product [Effrenium voratum]
MRLLKRFGSLHLAVGESTVSFQKFCDLLRLIHFPLNQSTCRHLFGQVCGGQREMPIDAFKALLMERTIQSMRFVMEGWNLKQARVRSHIRTFVRRLAEVDERQKEQAVDRFQRKLTAGFIRSFWQQLLRSSVREDFITHASLVRALAEHEACSLQDHEIHYMLRLFEHMTRLADFAEGVPMSYFLTGLTLVSVMPKSDKLELIFEAFDNDYDHCLLYKQIHEMCHCICVLKESARGASDEHFQAELSQQEGQRSYECIRWHLQRTCNVQGDIVSFPELSAAWEMQPGQALPGWVQIRWVAKAIPGFEAWASQALSTCGQTSLLEPPVKGVVARHAQGESYIFKDVLTTRFAKSLRDLGSRRLVELTRQFGDGKSKAAMPSVGQSGAMPGVSAMVLVQEAATALRAAAQTLSVFESTTAGLLQASLQAVPGASAFTTCGAVTYSKQKAHAVLGDMVPAMRPTNVANGQEYKESKRVWTQQIARHKRHEVGSTWCLCESGACGPSFTFPEINTGFSAIYVAGPIERGLFVESSHNEREANMWGFTKLALDFLAECVRDASDVRDAGKVAQPMPMTAKQDRFGGVEVEVSDSLAVGTFGLELRQGLEQWKAAGKKGIWLKIPLSAAACVGPAVAQGFRFHHAKDDYVLLTQWLASTPNMLPRFSFTQIGVGGVVLNSKGEILMVQERVSPLPDFQGSWKLPGGLADPGEDFADTVLREVKEETGVTATLLGGLLQIASDKASSLGISYQGLVSLRHSHGVRFGQGDIYVIVKLQAVNETIQIDEVELSDAKWMSEEAIKALVSDTPKDGKVSRNNWKILRNALHGRMIEGCALPNSRGGKMSMLYSAGD